VRFPDAVVRVPAAALPRLRAGWAIPVQQAAGPALAEAVGKFVTSDRQTRLVSLFL
jgi:hypothetical protein